MNFITIIPARFASTRFPGKPLALIHGKPMIQHVYERCKEVMANVFVATDDDRIVQAVKDFGGSSVLTSSNHLSGTDRCAEAARILTQEFDFDVVINVQGDEPFLHKEQLIQLTACFDQQDTTIATLITPILSYQVLFDQNKVKVVRSTNGDALYFSRHPIPFQRDVEETNWLDDHNYFMHLGMYAYRKDVLQEITQLTPSKLELAEKLEQLRWLDNGLKIKTAITDHQNFGVDTPLDLEYLLNKQNP
jgi:3-deoxy-manno-octulosonate cytidylyltransferase (CMP-KDO synthetase)